jgi:tetratricopeptide (TPR) repeat protein
MRKEELLERYEALGAEGDFLAAKPLYERALLDAPDARVLNEFGYLLECHGRRELRRAVELYKQAIELDPRYDKPHFQLISALAGLQEPQSAVRMYEGRLRTFPEELREYRFLATAHLKAGAYAQAREVVEAGLELREDAALIALRGEAKAGLGDANGALDDWRRALELEPEDIGALYSSAFLLEQEGRLAEAAEAWRSIIDWNESRGYTLQTEWPKEELARLRSV